MGGPDIGGGPDVGGNPLGGGPPVNQINNFQLNIFVKLTLIFMRFSYETKL